MGRWLGDWVEWGMNNTQQKSAHRQNGQHRGHAEQTPSPQKHNKNVRAQCKRIFTPHLIDAVLLLSSPMFISFQPLNNEQKSERERRTLEQEGWDWMGLDWTGNGVGWTGRKKKSLDGMGWDGMGSMLQP